MLLKALEIQGLTLHDVAERMGISITSARLYIQKGRIPRKKRWKQLSEVLGLTESDLIDHYHDLLADKGLLRHCKYCNKTFVARFETTLTCSRKCKDKIRIKSPKIRFDTKIPKIRMETRDEKDKVRDEIKRELNHYLESGLTITKLPEQPRIKFDLDEY